MKLLNNIDNLIKITENKDHTIRSKIRPGMVVYIVKKEDQKTGKLTRGVVKKVLTPGGIHTRGIKVRLTDGTVGRVQEIIRY
jgi:uncharacterized repeat protein (TIGR03833 family)